MKTTMKTASDYPMQRSAQTGRHYPSNPRKPQDKRRRSSKYLGESRLSYHPVCLNSAQPSRNYLGTSKLDAAVRDRGIVASAEPARSCHPSFASQESELSASQLQKQPLEAFGTSLHDLRAEANGSSAQSRSGRSYFVPPCCQWQWSR